MDSGSSLLSPRAATSEEYKKIILYTFEGKKIDF
jgi:hypothetical protein